MAKIPNLPSDFYQLDFLALGKNESMYHVRIRYLGMHHIKCGKSISSVSEILSVSTRTVAYWIKRYKEDGCDGLKDKPGRGAKLKLSSYDENKFRENVLEMQEVRNGGRITANDISAMLKSKFNVTYSLSSIYDLLKRVELSWISSRSKHPQQDPEAQELFKKLRIYRCRCPQCGSFF